MPKKFTLLTFKNVYPRDVNPHLRKGIVKCLCQKKYAKKMILVCDFVLLNFNSVYITDLIKLNYGH